MSWKHDDLANDLAAHLRGATDRMVWTDMQLGPAGSPRPDVYTVPCSFAKFRPVAYEIKISVSDFRRDVVAGKWMSYLKYASGVIFCVPAGLVKKEDVPPGCGLMTRGDTGWRSLKGATLKPVDTLPRDAWIKLLIDGLPRLHNDIPKEMRAGIENDWIRERRLRTALGDTVANAIRDSMLGTNDLVMANERLKHATEDARKRYTEIVSHAEDRARKESTQIDSARHELARALGLSADASVWDIVHASHDAAARLSADAEIVRLKNHLDTIERAIKRSAEPLPALCRIEGDLVES